MKVIKDKDLISKILKAATIGTRDQAHGILIRKGLSKYRNYACFKSALDREFQEFNSDIVQAWIEYYARNGYETAVRNLRELLKLC